MQRGPTGWLVLKYFPEDVVVEVLSLARFALDLELAVETRKAFFVLKNGKIAGVIIFLSKKPPKEDRKFMAGLEEKLGVPVYAVFTKSSKYIAIDSEGEEIPLEQEELGAFVDLVF
ncbi:hypothetical protein [Thermococcus pacificus]|uniref:Uncharacterized protein n=1 Tax=Thermococcus pacificus TaxID=71998 RepID=A0A218P6G7_9EURY|nr:hypothetical protein [Thermococcus pacificus]ASJ06376.1 hypothetical protein A3L08_03025 [Thermococcus pacificus]